MFNLTSKVLGYVAGGLGLATLAAGSFAGLQTVRLNSSEDTNATLRKSIERADIAFDRVVQVANQRSIELQGRDAIIAEQSASIAKVSEASTSNRERYLYTIRAADTGAKVNEARAVELTRPVAPPPAPDQRCEAARSLIIQELQNVR